MKIQELAIIFIIIIVPISIVLSAYTQFQIQTLNTQSLYDAKLTTATLDAIKAFQINTANSTSSDLSNSKLRDIEASVTTFKNSIMATFGLNGYAEEDLNNYIPALVYTMYDGFYIYSPYKNTNHLYTSGDGGNIEPLDNNGETMYGLKPYISYSCRYKKPGIDVVITYSLDNYITVQGTIGSDYVNKEGYLIDVENASYDLDADGKVTNVTSVTYNGIQIEEEELTEYVDGTLYSYIKVNGTKYYYDENGIDSNGNPEIQIFYISNGRRMVQGEKRGQAAVDYYNNYIRNNKTAMFYYAEAYVFTDWIRTNLSSLTYADAYDVTLVKNGDDWVQQEIQLFPGINKKIFDNSQNIENELSNFNRHRVDVIKHKIESNLSIAISNYNAYSSAQGIEFQLPNLNDDEWELAINNICLISFLQGLDIGGKIYNGYTVVNNSETKEVVKEESIYILGKDNYYHRIGDTYLETASNVGNTATDSIFAKSAGRSNLDFERQKIIVDNGGIEETRYYYPLRDYYGSYNSIVAQNNVTTFDDIYAYIQNENVDLAKAFYTALGRERYALYKALRTDLLY